jgi:hypothetical protein
MSEFLPHLTAAVPAVVIIMIGYCAARGISCAAKGISLLLAAVVGICTTNENRRAACVEIVSALCQAPSGRSRNPARPTLPTTRPQLTGRGCSSGCNSPPCSTVQGRPANDIGPA